jgi:hypothetical protein
MSIAEQISSDKRPFRISAPSENILLGIAAFAFLTIHIAAGTFVRTASSVRSTDQPKEAIVSYGD